MATSKSRFSVATEAVLQSETTAVYPSGKCCRWLSTFKAGPQLSEPGKPQSTSYSAQRPAMFGNVSSTQPVSGGGGSSGGGSIPKRLLFLKKKNKVIQADGSGEKPKKKREWWEEPEDDAEVDDTGPRYRPVSVDDLREKTEFSRNELKTMYRGFKQECPTGTVTEEKFLSIYAQFFPQGNSNNYAHYVFSTFDQEGSGIMNFEGFVIGLSTLCRGSIEDKIRWAFDLYDTNKDGVITKNEIQKILEAIYDIMGPSVIPPVTSEQIEEHAASAFARMDIRGRGQVTWPDFLHFCMQHPWIRRSIEQLDTLI